jgi:hypothetical protein
MGMTDNLKENKYVAFLDVLGFKELVKEKGHKLDKYFDTINKALKDINGDKPRLNSQLVSDSTILACDLNREDLRLLLKTVQTIQARCALENIWLRGAISIGDIYFDRTLNIVVGNGLSDAYILETQERFPRIIIDPKILSHDFGTREDFIQEYNNTFVGPGAVLRDIPLIHHLRGGQRYIDNDAFFVSFAERIAIDNCDDLETIYKNIQSELYKGQKNYQKYLWLKNYFTEAIGLHGNTEGESEPRKENRDKVREYANKFELL